jgi:hypothetical protein
VRTRTRLTTPPGQEPVAPHDEDDLGERYVPALAVPSEPRYPGRRRRLWMALLSVLVIAAVGYGAFRMVTAGQTFDPALNRGTDAQDQVIEQPTP